MLSVIRHLRLCIALLATLSYLGLGVAMARGDGTVVIEGQIVSVADLCGGDDDGSGCPFCTLGQAADMPAPAAADPVWQPIARCVLPDAPTILSTAQYVRPPARAPPLN